MTLRDRTAVEESIQEDVRRKFNPDFIKGKPKTIKCRSGESLHAAIKRYVDEDPLTVMGREVMSARWGI
jgi:hypothetical protein